MRLRTKYLWSPDLSPTDGLPTAVTAFNILVQVEIEDVASGGSELFMVTVCSPTVLGRADSGGFVTNTLVLDRFSWEAVRSRLETVLLHADSAKTWDEVIKSLAGLLKANDY